MAAPEQLKTRLLVSSSVALGLSLTGVLTGGAAFGAAALTTALGGELVNFFGDLSGGVAGGFLTDYIKQRPGDFRGILANKDLERATGRAIELLMAEEAKKLPDTEQRQALEKVAETAVARFRLVEANLDALDLAGLFSTPPEDFGKELSLSEADWAGLVRALGEKSTEGKRPRERLFPKDRQPLDPDTVARVARSLAARFPEAFHNVLKEDADEGGRAFGGMVLLLLSQILVAVRERPAGAGFSEARVIELVTGVTDSLSEEAQQHNAVVIQNLTTLVAHTDALSGGQREQLALLHRILEKLEGAAPGRAAPTLPEVTRHFTGRDDDVNGLLDLLDAHRLVTLTGTGGIGKTEVARAVSRTAAERQPEWAAEGVFYVNLEAADSPAAVIDTLVLELGLQPAPSPVALAQQLARPCLYVLDDLFPALCADRNATRDLVDALYVSARPARFLLTCRAALLPGKSKAVSLGRLHPPDDENLFRRVATDAGYAWQDGDDARLATLLHAADGLDGLPLALTLAAERLRYRPLESVLRDWQARRTKALRLPGLTEDDLGHLNSLDFSIALSYDLLPEDGPARALFALFAHLPGGVTEALLEAVLDDDGPEAADVLARHGLVRYEAGRFTMLMPLRAFAAAYAAPLADPLRPRLDRHLLEMAEHWGNDDEQWIKRKGEAVRRLTAALPNLHAALDRAGARADESYVAHLTDALRRFYSFAVPGPEARARLKEGATAAKQMEDERREANCIQSLGDVHQMLGEYHEARARFEEARPIYHAIGARLGEANAIRSLGDVHYMLDEYEEARARFEEARPIYHAIGARLGEANAIRSLGDVHQMLGEYHEARARFEEARPIYHAIGDRLGEANAIRSLGDVHQMLGEYHEARARFEEARPIYHAIGDRLGEANAIRSLGDVHQMLGEYHEARARFEEARPIYHAIGARLGEANAIRSLGDVHQMLGEYHEARARFEEARPIYHAIGARLGEANAIRSLGDVHYMLDEYEEARARFEEARPIYHAIGARLGEANAIRSLGDVHMALAEYHEARARFEEARPIFHAIGARLGEANAIRSLGDVHQMLGEYHEARARFEEARPIYHAIGDRLGEANAIRSLGQLYVAVEDFAQGRERYEEALALYGAIDSSYGVTSTHWYLAHLERAAGNPAAACAWMQQAAEGFAAIGLGPYEESARAFLTALGCADR